MALSTLAQLVDTFEPNAFSRDPFPGRTRIIETALESGETEATAAAWAAIELLDAIDGDSDLEPCLAGDDGCDYFRCGGNEGWGSSQHDHSFIPSYGVDQSEGPPNLMGAPRAGYEAQSWWG